MNYLISLKGGGIRGIIQNRILKSLVDYTSKLFLKSFPDRFMLAGSSTGALQAGALLTGMDLDAMLEVYMERTVEVFNHPKIEADGLMIERGFRFRSSNVYKVLTSILAPYITWTINDCPAPVLITAIGANNKPWYFVQDSPHNSSYTGESLLLHCMTASASAPTYFDQHYVPPCNGHLVGWCKDGGTGVLANPVHQLCIEAFKYNTFDPQNTRVISIGTGYSTDTSVNPPSGIIATISDATDCMLSNSDDEQGKLVNLYYPECRQVQLDVDMGEAISMDDLTARTKLLKIGTTYSKTIDWEMIFRT